MAYRRCFFTPVIGLLLTTSCGPRSVKFEDSANNQVAAAVNTSDGVDTIDRSDWRLGYAVDAITDEQVGTAFRRYHNGPFAFDVSIICRAGHVPAYQLTAFQGSDLASFIWVRQHAVLGPDWSASFRLRLDGGRPKDLESHEHRYANQIAIGGDTEFDSGSAALEAINARRAVFAVRLLSGDATIDIDQSDGPLRQYLDRCRQSEGHDHDQHPASAEPVPPASPPPSNGPPPPAEEGASLVNGSG